MGSGSGIKKILLIQSPFYPLRYWASFYELLAAKGYEIYPVDYPSAVSLQTPLFGGLQFEMQMRIKDKIKDEKINERVHLVAHGWACLLLAYSIGELEDSIASVTLISPMGLHSKVSFWERLVSWPVIGLLIHSLFKHRIWQQEFAGLAAANFRKFSAKRQLTVLRCNKILDREGVADYYEELTHANIPLLVMLGILTTRYHEPIHPLFKSWCPEVLMVPVHLGEHFLSIESPSETLEALEKFWNLDQEESDYSKTNVLE